MISLLDARFRTRLKAPVAWALAFLLFLSPLAAQEPQPRRQDLPPKVDQELLLQAAALPPDAPLELVVWLKDRPGARISREVRARRMPEIEAKAETIRRVHAQRRPNAPVSPAEEESLRHFLGSAPLPLTPEETAAVRSLSQEIENELAALRSEVRQRTEAAVAGDQARITSRVQALGGNVKSRLISQNAVVVSLPAGRLAELAADEKVARIIAPPAGAPDLDDQDDSLGLVNGFWADAIDGGIWDAGVLDSGVQQDHPAFGNVTFLSNMGNTDTQSHGTQVAGIIASGNATFRGLAFDIDQILVASASGNSGSMTGADWMVNGTTDDAEVINLSWGYGNPTVDYDSFDRFWDALVDDNSVLVVKSAGNNGVSPSGGTTLSRPASAYNIITVANMDDGDTAGRDDDVITASSSRGPTLGDRKKPDISAPGTNTMSTNPNWAGTNPDFVDFDGTSAAAPHVSAGVVLLTELRGSDNPMVNKAILINTADTWDDNGTQSDTSDDGEADGSQWNATYGWGYLDLWEAWFHALDVFTDTVDDGVTPAGPDFKLYRGRMFANDKATLVWNRHVTYNGDTSPTQYEDLTNLDLRVYRETTGTQIASSLSSIDNVEQIAVAATEDVILKVDVAGTLDPQVSVESYALAVEEGFQRVGPPAFSVSYSGPDGFFPSVPKVISVTVTNTGGVRAFNPSVSLTVPSGMVITSGANPRSIGTLAPGQSTTLSWTVGWNCGGNGALGTLRIDVSSASYGETISGVKNQSVFCENTNS